jgi:hypothetical protein
VEPHPRQLNRATLARQMLLRREPIGAEEGVRRAVAIQAQEPPSPYLALWNRLADLDPHDVDRVFADRTVVKATLMRITLHVVHVDDYTAFHAAMLPNLRAARLGDDRFTSSGLSIEDADALIPHVVGFASGPRTRGEIEAMLAGELGIAPDPGVWWALKTYAPLIHDPVDAPWSFDRIPRFVAAPDACPAGHDEQRGEQHGAEPGRELEDALRHLVRRYLEGFGPASAEDIARFSLQKRRVVRTVLNSMQDDLVTYDGPDTRPLFDLPDRVLPDADTPAPARLLGMWDSVLLAYEVRSRVIPDEYLPHVIRRNGDVLPTLLVDGYVAGVWRADAERIEARAFHPLTDDVWDELAEEATRLRRFVASRDPAPYSRYDRWWEKLPAGPTRVLSG